MIFEMRKVKLSALLGTELKSKRKILEKWCIKISSKLPAEFLVAPRSLADSVHIYCRSMHMGVVGVPSFLEPTPQKHQGPMMEWLGWEFH